MSVTVALVSGTLRVNQREDQYMELQQNMRAAIQQVAQDLRSSGQLHVWNQACVAPGYLCSDNTHIAAVTLDGGRAAIPEAPGNSFNNSAETRICDATSFNVGDVAIVFTSDASTGTPTMNYQLIEISNVQLQADHSKPCVSGNNPNTDKVQHNSTKISGTWQSSSYMLHAQLVSYYVGADPTDATRTALFRRTGLNTQGPQTGLLAFDITGLRFSYAVAPAGSDTVKYYDTLTAAATALGTAQYSDLPGYSAGKTFVGSLVRAVRVQLTGQTRNALSPGGSRATYTLTETVDLRRPVL